MTSQLLTVVIDEEPSKAWHCGWEGVAKCPLFSFAVNQSSCDFRWETEAGRSKHPVFGQLPSALESFRNGESLLDLTMSRKVLNHCLGFGF